MNKNQSFHPILLASLILGLATGCAEVAGNRDHLVGWFNLPQRHYGTREVLPGPGTLIPVFKIDGAYYSVARGFEVPLNECPGGLEWGPADSSMKGTMIGVDEASNAPYIVIDDANAQYEADASTRGEKQFMSRSDPPSGLRDPTTTAPRTADDFPGWYEPVWFPWVRIEIRKEGDRYVSRSHEFHGPDPGAWTADDGVRELVPLPDEPGFSGFERHGGPSLVYNKTLKRFELVMGTSPILRMPLARVSSPYSPEGGERPPTTMRIGIPTWH